MKLLSVPLSAMTSVYIIYVFDLDEEEIKNEAFKLRCTHCKIIRFIFDM